LSLLRLHRAHRQPLAPRAGRVRAPLRPPRRILIDHLFEFFWRVGHWSYLLLFLGAALESAAFLGFLVPGETIVILGGVLASTGVLDLPQTLAIVASGAIIGDNVGYYLGRRLGRPFLERHPKLFGDGEGIVARVDALFAQHGGKAVLIGRFVGFLRALAPFVAGASRMPYRTFAVYNAIGATAWGIAFVLLGYFLGESWTLAEKWLGRAGLLLGSLAIIAIFFYFRQQRRRKRRRRGAKGTKPATPA
jgi:undecaprenyl-diphosphatase